MNPTPDQPDPTVPTDPTEDFKPFSKWTDDEIRNRAAELHEESGLISIDETRPVIREDDEVAYVPAWIEIAPWD